MMLTWCDPPARQQCLMTDDKTSRPFPPIHWMRPRSSWPRQCMIPPWHHVTSRTLGHWWCQYLTGNTPYISVWVWSVDTTDYECLYNCIWIQSHASTSLLIQKGRRNIPGFEFFHVVFHVSRVPFSNNPHNSLENPSLPYRCAYRCTSERHEIIWKRCIQFSAGFRVRNTVS